MEIRFLSVGCGDGIHIRYYGTDGRYYNIFIDGGVEKGNVYPEVLKKEIEQIIDANEQIDLWIISHIDDDHIGGVLRFIKDSDTRNQVNLAKTSFWFNYSPFDYEIGIKTTILKSVSQGIRLRDFLKRESRLYQNVSTAMKTFDLQGCSLTILSPDQEQVDRLYEKWLKEEIKIVKKKTSSKKAAKENDYHIKLDDFDLSAKKEDRSEFNASSISLLLEYNGEKVLLLADSQPSKIIKSLAGMLYSDKNKLKLKLMQLPHHGSKYNTSDELLQMIDCDTFVISADGYNKHNLPHKEVLARVKKNFPDQVSKIHITHKNAATNNLLKVDEKQNGIDVLFPECNENYIKISI